MKRLTEYPTHTRANCALRQTHAPCAPGQRTLLPNTILALTILVVTITVMLSGCGGSASDGVQQGATLSGNWQFTMAPQTDGNPADPIFNGGLQGGFLLQNSGQNDNSASGQTVYSVMSPTAPSPCNSGSAPIAV